MKISELNTGQGNVAVEGTLKEIGETRTFNKFGKNLSVANAILKDDSGAIKLTLWNDDITRFKDGDKIKILNGYVNEFQGEKQLTSGKFGTIEKIDSDTKENKEPEEDSESENSQEEVLF
ncbi:MAG: DNA-binding protein [Nanoarchaeota archaeon]